MNKIRGMVSLGLFGIAVVAVFGVVAAPLAAADCAGIETAIISCAENANATLEIIKLVLKILMGLVGIAAVGALIFAGILYSSASGDQGQVQKAKTMIQNTVIGIVLFGTMILIGNWLIPGGVFGGDITNNGNGKSEGGGTSEGREASGESSSQAPTKASDTITIATWNIKFNNSTANIKSGAKKIANSGADLIGFQELNFPASRKAIQDGLIDCKGCDYSGYFPGGSGESGWDNRATVSLVWNKSKFEKLDQNSESVSNADAAANTGAKWINWVKLKDIKTGTIFYFANTHFVAEVRQKSSNSQIKQNYYHHLDELIGFIKDIKEPVIIAGDFNMAYNYDKANDHAYDGRSYSPLRRLNKYDIYSNWQYAKKSTMSIDYVWASKRDEVQFVSTKKWSGKMGSDHSPATMTLKLYEE